MRTIDGFPAEPLWPLVFSLCDTAKKNGTILSYEVAEKCFLSLIEAEKQRRKEGVQFGGLEYTTTTDGDTVS